MKHEQANYKRYCLGTMKVHDVVLIPTLESANNNLIRAKVSCMGSVSEELVSKYLCVLTCTYLPEWCRLQHDQGGSLQYGESQGQCREGYWRANRLSLIM